MDYHSTLQDIRKRCRMAMNGDASAGMRKYGLVYKLNFGLMVSQIRDLAKSYSSDAGLASLLWEQDTRELKILATMLYPVDEMTSIEASKWATEIPNQEIREQIVLNLFQKLADAHVLATEWTHSENSHLRATGYWLIGRLLLCKISDEFDDIDQLPKIWTDVLGEDLLVRNGALLALKQIGRRDKRLRESILSRISSFPAESEFVKSEVLDSLSFEFEFFA